MIHSFLRSFDTMFVKVLPAEVILQQLGYVDILWP